MLAYYGTQISPNQLETEEGFLICKNVPIARTGKQLYRAGDLQLTGDPGRGIWVERTEEEVFDPAAMASFEGKPVTDNHPPENLEPYNAAGYAKGHVQNVRREGDFLMADLFITDPALISEVKSNAKREISCGYVCNYVPAGDGYKQEKIRGNHVAVVPLGRAGHEVAIQDEKTINEKGGKGMNKFHRDLLRLFGRATKDASEQELEQMTDAAAAALEMEPEKTPEPEASAPTEDGLGMKLDQVLALLEALSQGAKEKAPEPHLTDEGDLDKEIARLAGDTGEEAALSSITPVGDGCRTADALEVLRRVRPAVAAMKDPEEKQWVADALISSVRGDMGGLLYATRDAAAKNGQRTQDAAATAAEQQEKYDSRNPHKTKH